MGSQLRAFDWAATPLGPIYAWPAVLRIAVDSMMSSAFPSFMFWGPDLIAIYNDGYVPMLGNKPLALGQPLRVTWSEVWDDLRPIADKALRGEATFIEDFLIRVNRRGHLEDAYFTFCYGPVFDEDGQVVGMLDTVMETTPKVLAMREALQERERQQGLLRQMPGFVAVLSGPRHVFSYVNDAYIKISGPRDFMGRTVRDVFPELDGQGFYEMLDSVYATGEPIRASAVPIQLHGETFSRYIDLLYAPTRDHNGDINGIFVGGYDVTERKQAESEAVASQEQLRALNAELERKVIERTQARGRTWQVSPDLMGALDNQGYFRTSNPAWQTLLGWSEEEVAGMSIFSLLHPDDEARTREGFNLTLVGQPAIRFQNRYRCKDGSYRWISWTGVPEDGMVYCTGRDITAEKAAEANLQRAQEALRQAQKMEAVGQLTGGIAHDFNNLLAAISGNLQVMKLRLARGHIDDLQRHLDVGEDSVRKAASLTQRLLAFSRQQTLAPQPTDVNRLLQGMEGLLRGSVGPAINLDVRRAEGLWTTRIDPSQLENAVLNLCLNARDAMPAQGGQITVATANTCLDEKSARELGVAAGDYVSISVADTGTGMPAKVVERIFDPFYTTKPLGKGTGLGLSMVYGFVLQSGGRVSVDSQVGRGTTMRFYLPRHLGEAGAGGNHPVARPAEKGGGETVVLIEDEPAIREFLSDVLRDAGYRVLLAEDGAKGLGVLGSAERVDLLITDVGLPGGMNGRQVADTARLAQPSLKVLFITGYAANAAVGNGQNDHGMDVLTKPFEIEALLRKARVLIDQTAA